MSVVLNPDQVYVFRPKSQTYVKIVQDILEPFIGKNKPYTYPYYQTIPDNKYQGIQNHLSGKKLILFMTPTLYTDANYTIDSNFINFLQTHKPKDAKLFVVFIVHDGKTQIQNSGVVGVPFLQYDWNLNIVHNDNYDKSRDKLHQIFAYRPEPKVAPPEPQVSTQSPGDTLITVGISKIPSIQVKPTEHGLSAMLLLASLYV